MLELASMKLLDLLHEGAALDMAGPQWPMSAQFALLMHLPSPVGCYIIASCGICIWLIGSSVYSVPASSSGPGCDYRSQEHCGLSVGVS